MAALSKLSVCIVWITRGQRVDTKGGSRSVEYGREFRVCKTQTAKIHSYLVDPEHPF